MSGKESGEESDRASGGERGTGDRGVYQGSGRGGVPGDGYPGCFLHCVTGCAPCQANGGGYGGAHWNGGGGRHPSSCPSPWTFSPCVFPCWFSCWGSGGGGWNGGVCRCLLSVGPAPSCSGMVGCVLVGSLTPVARWLRAGCSLPQRFVTLRLGWLRCCRWGCRRGLILEDRGLPHLVISHTCSEMGSHHP